MHAEQVNLSGFEIRLNAMEACNLLMIVIVSRCTFGFRLVLAFLVLVPNTYVLCHVFFWLNGLGGVGILREVPLHLVKRPPDVAHVILNIVWVHPRHRAVHPGTAGRLHLYDHFDYVTQERIRMGGLSKSV